MTERSAGPEAAVAAGGFALSAPARGAIVRRRLTGEPAAGEPARAFPPADSPPSGHSGVLRRAGLDTAARAGPPPRLPAQPGGPGDRGGPPAGVARRRQRR